MYTQYEKATARYGYVGVENGGYFIAVCENCHAVAFMTRQYRDSEEAGSILARLGKVVGCCKAPDFYFEKVFILKQTEGQQ